MLSGAISPALATPNAVGHTGAPATNVIAKQLELNPLVSMYTPAGIIGKGLAKPGEDDNPDADITLVEQEKPQGFFAEMREYPPPIKGIPLEDLEARFSRIEEADKGCALDLQRLMKAFGGDASFEQLKAALMPDEKEVAVLATVGFSGIPGMSEQWGPGFLLLTQLPPRPVADVTGSPRPVIPPQPVYKLHVVCTSSKGDFEGSEEWGANQCLCFGKACCGKAGGEYYYKSVHGQEFSVRHLILKVGDVRGTQVETLDQSKFVAHAGPPGLKAFRCPCFCLLCCWCCRCVREGGRWFKKAVLDRDGRFYSEAVPMEEKKDVSVSFPKVPEPVALVEKKAMVSTSVHGVCIDFTKQRGRSVAFASPTESLGNILKFSSALSSLVETSDFNAKVFDIESSSGVAGIEGKRAKRLNCIVNCCRMIFFCCPMKLSCFAKDLSALRCGMCVFYCCIRRARSR